MNTTRFTVSVSVLTPFPYRSIRGCVSLSLLGEQFAYVDVAQVDPDRPVYEPVDHGVRLDPASEPAVPFSRRVLRAQYRRLRHVAPLDQLEQEADVQVIDALGEPFVDADESLIQAEEVWGLPTFWGRQVWDRRTLRQDDSSLQLDIGELAAHAEGSLEAEAFAPMFAGRLLQ